VRVDLEAHPLHLFRMVEACLRHVLKQLEGSDVWISFWSDRPDLRHTSLGLGVTGLLARPKA
jgi:hypothetical protein